MKKFFLTMGLLMVFKAHAAVVDGARYDFIARAIEVDVTTTGGCEDHEYDLVLEPCRETWPVSCDLQLVEDTKGDTCMAVISETVRFPLVEIGISDVGYFSGATLTIMGAGQSRAIVVLPTEF